MVTVSAREQKGKFDDESQHNLCLKVVTLKGYEHCTLICLNSSEIKDSFFSILLQSD